MKTDLFQLTFYSPVATAEFSKFAGILSAALSKHHLSGFEIAPLELHHLHSLVVVIMVVKVMVLMVVVVIMVIVMVLTMMMVVVVVVCDCCYYSNTS